MGCDDATLMRRWQRGDATAFEELVRRWQQRVGRFLFRMAGRADLVPDLCQEVFLRVYHAGPRYRETSSFSAWLYRIALNVARDAGRKDRRRPEPLGDREPAGRDADDVCRRELADAVAAAVAELPEPLRAALVLRHYEGMSFEEIARLTDTPASTVKSRFAAALARLRDRLSRLGWAPEETDT